MADITSVNGVLFLEMMKKAFPVLERSLNYENVVSIYEWGGGILTDKQKQQLSLYFELKDAPLEHLICQDIPMQ